MWDEDRSRPVVEWIEASKIEALAIFNVEDTRLPFSHIMLFGNGIGWERGGKCFNQRFLEWKVDNMQHLEQLLRATQRVLGIHYSTQPETSAGDRVIELEDFMPQW
jgi:hypothetical protein